MSALLFNRPVNYEGVARAGWAIGVAFCQRWIFLILWNVEAEGRCKDLNIVVDIISAKVRFASCSASEMIVQRICLSLLISRLLPADTAE